jgi:hypothetical protein
MFPIRFVEAASDLFEPSSKMRFGNWAAFPRPCTILGCFQYLSLRIAVLRNFFVCTSGFRASRSLAQALLPFEGFLITRTCVEPRLIFTRTFDRRMGNASFARSVRIHAKLPIEKVAGVFHLEYSHTPPRLPQ